MVLSILTCIWWINGLFVLSGITDSVVMGFSGLSRLLLVFIQIAIVILPNFYTNYHSQIYLCR